MSPYGRERAANVDELGYQMYCQNGAKIACELLPRCSNVLKLHIQRANYQAWIWRNSLVACQDIPDPINHGWVMDTEYLNIKWMTCSPAPEEIIELMSCHCRRKC